ncbi:hypothetical protein JHK85_011682 [Glycine max]|nr:hypothetical protein JHK85_011682 [Glycine max]
MGGSLLCRHGPSLQRKCSSNCNTQSPKLAEAMTMKWTTETKSLTLGLGTQSQIFAALAVIEETEAFAPCHAVGSEDLGILEYQIRSLECLKSRAAVPVATTIARVLIHTDDYQTRLQASYPSSLLCPEEFVAHASTVNCLKIGRKSSRVLVTGGEDHKVNLWAIGKPNAILSLSGHSSGIDSVSFDSSEVLVAAGAASGTIKLWDLEEAKIVRTLTSHRSNCTSVDFHPFGEFFASGSLDTNLKIWDIRKKGCIHTYKGHTRGVNAIRFTPDGRWVVSGGEDNTVKELPAPTDMQRLSNLTAFLSSADRTVKFWDLETFELIGSAGPETTGVRSLTFSPDGRTLLCGLHESLKVFSWEPIRCHDMVDVGWSRLSDLNVHEGKLLGCSYNQSCVGVWVVDISRIEPYALNNVNHLNGHSETKSSSGNMTVLNEITAKARLSVSQNPDQLLKEIRSLGRLSVSQDSDSLKEGKCLASTGSAPSTPQRINLNSGPKAVPGGSTTVLNTTAQKRSSLKSHTASSVPLINKSDIIPIIVPRTSMRSEPVADSRKEVGVSGRTMPFPLQSKAEDIHKFPNNRDDVDKPLSPVNESAASKGIELSGFADKNNFPVSVSSMQDEARGLKVNRDVCSVEVQKGGRMRSLLNLEKRERSLNYEGPRQGISHGRISSVHVLPFSGSTKHQFQQLKGYPSILGL